MLWVFTLFVIIAIAVIAPILLGQSKRAIQEMEASLDIRLRQLKRDFQFQNKELKRRLNQGDLDESEWQELSEELKKETASSLAGTERAVAQGSTKSAPIMFVALMLFVAAVAYMTYLTVGFGEQQIKQSQIVDSLLNNPSIIDDYRKQLDEDPSQEMINEYYLALRARVDLAPEDVNNWRDLTYFNANYGRQEQAMETLKVALKKHPQSVDLKVDKAQLLVMSSETQEIIEGHRLLSEILQQDPEQQRALLIKGDSAYRIGMYDIATQTWRKLKTTMQDNQAMLKALDDRINMAQQRQAGNVPEVAPDNGSPSELDNQSRPGVNVAVTIAPELMDRLDGNETMFIFARAENGPAIPVAVAKLKVGDIRGPVLLDDRLAMQPQFKLSNYDAITITARISFTENATPTAGDIQGQSERVTRPFPAQPVAVVLNEVVE